MFELNMKLYFPFFRKKNSLLSLRNVNVINILFERFHTFDGL